MGMRLTEERLGYIEDSHQGTLKALQQLHKRARTSSGQDALWGR